MKKILLISVLALLGMSQAVALEYEYVPFVREGVIWVYRYDNPLSSIMDPDFEIGRHYFKLELKGDTVINGKVYKAMHKYSGASINWENDTVPVYLREEDKIVYGIIPDGRRFFDCPVGVVSDNKDYCYDGQEFVLYDFADPITYWTNLLHIPSNRPPRYYEFLGVDTIPLGNRLVRRYVWMYPTVISVEGVGGDLNTDKGYTLYPYYETYPTSVPCSKIYFSFSHVIEDGRIVFKGHRFVPEDFPDSDSDNQTAIDELAVDKACQADGNYYNLMGQPMGKQLPTTPGIYIHHGKKIVVR